MASRVGLAVVLVICLASLITSSGAPLEHDHQACLGSADSESYPVPSPPPTPNPPFLFPAPARATFVLQRPLLGRALRPYLRRSNYTKSTSLHTPAIQQGWQQPPMPLGPWIG